MTTSVVRRCLFDASSVRLQPALATAARRSQQATAYGCRRRAGNNRHASRSLTAFQARAAAGGPQRAISSWSFRAPYDRPERPQTVPAAAAPPRRPETRGGSRSGRSGARLGRALLKAPDRPRRRARPQNVPRRPRHHRGTQEAAAAPAAAPRPDARFCKTPGPPTAAPSAGRHERLVTAPPRLKTRPGHHAQDRVPPQLLEDVQNPAPTVREGAHRRRAQAGGRVRPPVQARALAHAARARQAPEIGADAPDVWRPGGNRTHLRDAQSSGRIAAPPRGATRIFRSERC